MDLRGLRYDELVDLARRALSEAAGRDVTELTEAEVLDAAQASTEVAVLATAVQTAAAGRLDVSKAWQTSGVKSAGAWLAWKCRLPSKRANAVVRCARRLRDLPGTDAAFLAGQLTADHVTLLAFCHTADPDAFAAEESLLVGHGSTMAFRHFERVIAYWLALHDPDGCERDAEAKHAARRTRGPVDQVGGTGNDPTAVLRAHSRAALSHLTARRRALEIPAQPLTIGR